MKSPKVPLLARQFLAELFGTFILIFMGEAVIAQHMAEGQNKSTFQVAFGFGVSLVLAVLATGGVSGGHFNPAVTLGLFAVGKVKAKQLPVYMAAQYLGAFIGAAAVYGLYAEWIDELGGGKNLATAGIFATYPKPFSGAFTLIWEQIMGTAMLIVLVMGIGDERNMRVPHGMVPLYAGLGLMAVILGFGHHGGAGINPARDLSPRLFTWAAGWGSDVWSLESGDALFSYFFWIPWLLPHVGGVLGAVLYYVFVELWHPEPKTVLGS